MLDTLLIHYAMPKEANMALDSLAGYRTWAWEKMYRGFMKSWAALGATYVGLCLRDMEGQWQRSMMLLQFALLLSILAATIPSLAKRVTSRPCSWVALALLFLSANQIIITAIIGYDGQPAGRTMEFVCRWWLDAITIIYLGVPTVVYANFSVRTWLTCACLQVCANTLFSMQVLGYNMTFAAMKIICIQALGLYLYLAMERSTLHIYFTEQKQNSLAACKRLGPVLTKTGQLSQSCTSSSQPEEVPLVARCEAKGVCLDGGMAFVPGSNLATYSLTKPCPSQDSKPGQKPVNSPYVPKLSRTKVMIKIDAHTVEPDALTQASLQKLVGQLLTNLDAACVLKAATRHGCVVVSLELLQLAQQQQRSNQPFLCTSPEDSGSGAPAHSTVLQWLQHSDLHAKLPHGTAIYVQVHGSMLKWTWDESSAVWDAQEHDTQLDLTAQYAVALPEVAIALPEVLPGLQATQQQGAGSVQVSFNACITAPPNTVLVGWPNRVDSTSNDGGHQVLQLLALADGIYVPLEVSQSAADMEAGGQFAVEVNVTLPSKSRAACACLKLELVRGNAVVGSCNGLLARFEEVQELRAATQVHAWNEVVTYVEDLAEWLLWRSLLHMAQPHTNSDNGGSSSSSSSSSSLSLYADQLLGSPAPNSNIQDLEANTIGPFSDGNLPSLLPLLMAEACRPGFLQPMTKVGLELLQHAVTWGMPLLAAKLLGELMAAPLSLPFHVVATLAMEQASAEIQQQSSSKAAGQEQVMECQPQPEGVMECSPHCSGSLHAAGQAVGSVAHGAAAKPSARNLVLSPRNSSAAAPCQGPDAGMPPSSLLACAIVSMNLSVLKRVLAWGVEYGHTWDLQSADACYGCPPLQLLEVLDPAWAEQAASAMPQGWRAPTTSTVMAPAWHQASKLAQRQMVFRASVCGFGEQGMGLSEEAYREWCRLKELPYARVVSCFIIFLFYVSAARSFYNGLRTSGIVMLVYTTPWVLVLLSTTTKQRKSSMLLAKAFHLALLTLFGLGLLPSIVATKCALSHLDWIVEAFLYRMMEQVHLRSLLLERTVAFMSIALFYSHLGMSFPMLRSLALNVFSVAVGIGMDIWNRQTYITFMRVQFALQLKKAA